MAPDSSTDRTADPESTPAPRPTGAGGLVWFLTSRPQRQVLEVKNQTRKGGGDGESGGGRSEDESREEDKKERVRNKKTTAGGRRGEASGRVGEAGGREEGRGVGREVDGVSRRCARSRPGEPTARMAETCGRRDE